MKVIQSFWSGNQTNFKNNYGWYSHKYNWLSWILSCHQLVKYHKDVELYTDSFGFEILITKLQLPYTKVHVVLDDLNSYHKDLWAIAKIKTFQMQEEPFLHVDGDVFVWESLTNKFKNSDLVTQNLEITTDYYGKMWEIIFPNLGYLPLEMESYNNKMTSFACNMGIVGGNDINFFKEYTKKSTDFVDKNKDFWYKINGFNFNIFFEQVLFYEYAKTRNKNIEFLFEEINDDNDYKGFGDFDKVPYKSYLHLLGGYKKNLPVCKAMEIYLMKNYPENYSKLSKLINEENKNNNEIEILNTEKVNELLIEFEIEIRTTIFKTDHFLLKRDLYNEGLANKLDTFLIQTQNFWIVTLKGFERKIIEYNKKEVDCLIIEEININSRIYDLDEIDDIILSEIIKPIKYLDFIKKIKKYLEENDNDSVTEFIFLINQRLRNYLILKIISIYN